MLVDGMEAPKMTFKDTLLSSSNGAAPTSGFKEDDPFVIGDDDVTREFDDIEPKIVFKERIMTLVEKSMESTVVVKLLGRSISYNALQNRLWAIWKLRKCPFRGPWIVYGHNLTIQPWSVNFNPLQSHLTSIVAWIRIRSVPGALYKAPLVVAIGEMIGKVVKIDDNTSAATRGRFARLAVTVDLSKSLKSRIWVNGKPYDIEYESLPLICYGCGRYGHLKTDCPDLREKEKEKTDKDSHIEEVVTAIPESREKFGPWMVVQKKHRRSGRNMSDKVSDVRDRYLFSAIATNEEDERKISNDKDRFGAAFDSIAELSLEDFLAIKGKRVAFSMELNINPTQANKNKGDKDIGPNVTKRFGKAQLGKGTKVSKLSIHQAKAKSKGHEFVSGLSAEQRMAALETSSVIVSLTLARRNTVVRFGSTESPNETKAGTKDSMLKSNPTPCGQMIDYGESSGQQQATNKWHSSDHRHLPPSNLDAADQRMIPVSDAFVDLSEELDRAAEIGMVEEKTVDAHDMLE
ncbi:hypothetical protein AAHA92_16967 [Salvia divinorum]|uniref:CCHC-type domain-containing protein n=1 Tax=Salvia divinorum TaxID=28513 RepID=A0ABD1H081_SALDI